MKKLNEFIDCCTYSYIDCMSKFDTDWLFKIKHIGTELDKIDYLIKTKCFQYPYVLGLAIAIFNSQYDVIKYLMDIKGIQYLNIDYYVSLAIHLLSNNFTNVIVDTIVDNIIINGDLFHICGCAVRSENKYFISRLCENNKLINSILFDAVRYDNISIVSMLLDTNINANINIELTPCTLPMIKLLISNGADIDKIFYYCRDDLDILEWFVSSQYIYKINQSTINNKFCTYFIRGEYDKIILFINIFSDLVDAYYDLICEHCKLSNKLREKIDSMGLWIESEEDFFMFACNPENHMPNAYI